MSTVLSTIPQRFNTCFRVYVGSLFTLNSSKLVYLPVEVLVEILKLLTWKDVLQIRGTCKYLKEATQTREIWAHLVNGYLTTNSLPPWLERPIELYSSQELEQHLLLWHSAEQGLDSNNLQPARERTFMGSKAGKANFTAHLVHLIKGGRWLLIAEQTGAVKYYDLEADTITEVSLIPDQMEYMGGCRVLMSVDISSQSSFLELSIALSLRGLESWEEEIEPGGGLTRHQHKFQIWRVNSILNDTQHIVGLEATCLTSFPHHPDMSLMTSISLVGPHLGCIIRSSGKIYGIAIVIDWTELNGDSLTYPWWVIQCVRFHRTCIHLLPGGKAFVASEHKYSFHDYASHPQTSTSPDDWQYSLPTIWQTIGPNCATGSSCFFSQSKATISLGEKSRASNISFDYTALSKESPPVETVHLPPSFYLSWAYIGCKYTVLVVNDGLMTIIPLSHGITTRPSRKCLLSKPCQFKHWTPILDEDSGRLVYNVNAGKTDVPGNAEFAVVDFAMIFK